MDKFKTFRGYQLDNKKEGQITSAMEDYLEMIYRLCKKHKYTKISKISQVLNVRPSSASKMVSKLTELGYLDYELGGVIFLTKKGDETGKYLYNRHKTIFDFLSYIGSKKPLTETELVEHVLSDDTISKLKSIVNFIESNKQIKNEYINFLSKIEKN